MDPHRVLERGVGADLAGEAGVLQLFRMRNGPLTFGCIRCGREHRSRMVAIVEDRELDLPVLLRPASPHHPLIPGHLPDQLIRRLRDARTRHPFQDADIKHRADG